MAKSRTPSTTSLEGFAEDLGKLLGTAQAKAEGWLSQRRAIAKQLTGIRDTASGLLQQLAGSGASLAAAVGRGHRRGRPAGRKGRAAAGRKRKMSARARRAISLAQKKRWAALKARAKEK